MLNSNNTLLIIIDVQGNLARGMYNADDLFQNLSILIQGARLLDIPILWMEQLPEKLGMTIDEISQHLKGLNPIEKETFSCFKNDEFKSKLNDINPDNVVLCGIETHICVYQTALDLDQQSFNVEVVGDATSSRSNNNKEIGLEKIRGAGADITSVETFLFQIQSVATGDKFRKLVKLVK